LGKAIALKQVMFHGGVDFYFLSDVQVKKKAVPKDRLFGYASVRTDTRVLSQLPMGCEAIC
jgi:hypothetical protein